MVGFEIPLQPDSEPSRVPDAAEPYRRKHWERLHRRDFATGCDVSPGITPQPAVLAALVPSGGWRLTCRVAVDLVGSKRTRNLWPIRASERRSRQPQDPSTKVLTALLEPFPMSRLAAVAPRSAGFELTRRWPGGSACFPDSLKRCRHRSQTAPSPFAGVQNRQ